MTNSELALVGHEAKTRQELVANYRYYLRSRLSNFLKKLISQYLDYDETGGRCPKCKAGFMNQQTNEIIETAYFGSFKTITRATVQKDFCSNVCCEKIFTKTDILDSKTVRADPKEKEYFHRGRFSGQA